MLAGDPHCESKDKTKGEKDIIKDYLSLQYAAIKQEKPDLVILMGDNASEDGAEELKKVLLRITKPYADSNTPFSFILGNHDLQRGIKSIDEIYRIYKELPFCILPEDHNKYGDFDIQIKSTDGTKTALNLFFIYSGDAAEEKYYSYYDFVKPEQNNRLIERSEAVNKENGKTPAVLFQHIPVPEEINLMKKSSFWSLLTDGTPGQNEMRGSFYRLKNKSSGYMGEAPCPSAVNSAEFDAVKKTGSIFAMFFGHDHLNDFVDMYDGIIMGQCKLSSFNAYGDGLMQGVRILEFDENAPFTVKTRMVRFRDFFEDNSRSIKWSLKLFKDRTNMKIETSLKAAGIVSAASLPILLIKLLKK